METAVSTEEEKLFTKAAIIKNLVVVALGSMLLLGSDDVLLTYQSSINQEGGKGVASILVQFSFCVLASFFLPKYFILRFGYKATMVIGGLNFIPFFVTNYYPKYYLMITSSFMLSFGYALFLGAIDPYINDLAFFYDRLCARDAGKSTGTDLKKYGVVCIAYVKTDIEKIPSASKEVDCISKDCEMNKNIDGNISTCHQSSFMFGRKFSLEGEQNFPQKRYISANQTPSEMTCACNEKHEIDRISKTSKNLGNIDTEKIYKGRLKSKSIEEIRIYSSDAYIKCICANHSNIVDKALIKSNFENPRINDGDIKKEPAQTLDSTKCKTEWNKTDMVLTSQCPEKESRNLESITVRFFGFHSMIYQTCYMWSSLVSFFVLQNGFIQEPFIFSNETCLCGASFCNVESACSEYNLRQPTAEARTSLISVCVGLCLLACVVIFLFLEDLKPKDKSVSLSLLMLFASYRQMKKKNQILLSPLAIYIGMMKGFYLADFTKVPYFIIQFSFRKHLTNLNFNNIQTNTFNRFEL